MRLSPRLRQHTGTLPLVEAIGDTELFDALEVVYFDEQRSVEELRMMLKD